MNKETKKTKRSIVFLILRIFAAVLCVVGIAILIVGVKKQVPEMGEPGWFDKSSERNGLVYGGISCIVMSLPLFLFSFIPQMQKMLIKMNKHILQSNMQDLTELSSMGADIISPSVAKTVKIVKENSKDVEDSKQTEGTKDQMFCKYCGKKIDAESLFCKHCGKKQ